jgi:putative ABC transport system permease protein
LYTVPLRLRSLFRSRAVERDLDDEVRFHLEKQVDRYIESGMAPEEARCAALRQSGGVEQRKEECRDMRHVRLVDEAIQDVRYALRAFRKAPAFTAVVLLTLALGIGANTAVFSVVYGVLFAPLPYPDPDRLVVIYGTQPAPANCPTCPASYEEYLGWREQTRVFDAIGASMPGRMVLTGRGDAEELPIAAVSASLSRVFLVAPQLGRWFTEEEDRPEGAKVAVLTDRLWRRRFGRDARVLGQTVVLDGTPRTIIGVMPAGFSHRAADVFVPIDWRLEQGLRGTHMLSVYGRLKAGLPFEQARAGMIALGHRLARERPRSNPHARDGIDIRPYHSVVVRPPTYPAPPRATPADLLLVLQAAVVFVLLVACANVANLQLARTAGRRREIAVRSALGASRTRLARQFATEGLMLTTAGAALGLGLASAAVRAFVALGPPVLPRMATLGISLPVLVFTAAVAITTALVFGLAPLLHVKRGGPAGGLRDDGSRTAASRRSRRAGQALVLAEVALSATLLVGAGLTVKSLWLLQHEDLGLRVDRILTFTSSLPDARYRSEQQVRDFYARALTRLRSLPGVELVGTISNLPMGPGANGFIELEGSTPWKPSEPPLVEQRRVAGDYHQVMGIPLVRGRYFTEADNPGAKPVVLVNQRLARLCWPNEEPIGKRIRLFRGWAEVVGVIADARIIGPAEAPPLEMVRPHQQATSSSLTFVVRSGTGDPAALATAVRKEMTALDAGLPLTGMATMEAVVGESLARPTLMSVLFSAFAALAALLAIVGVHGLMAYTISGQRQEFGIRLAMGASPGSLLRMTLARGGGLVVGGMSLGLLGAVALTRFMTAMLYGVEPTDPTVLAGACALILAAGLAGCLPPARAAARVDPVETLRAP